MNKKVFIAGCTGSIGIQAINVIDNLEGFEISALLAGKNKEKLEELKKQTKCNQAYLAKDNYSLEKLIDECDFVINAISGFSGLELSIATLKAGKTLCLANKESIVVAGHILFDLVHEFGGVIIPIDSEHSAIAQCMDEYSDFAKIWITASGGALRDMNKEEFLNAKKEQALKHPNWSMGQKITIDSATMFNKALEIIEAKWLFDLAPDEIIPVIHRQSIVHSMVEFLDGSITANLSYPNMEQPIQMSLTWPTKVANNIRKLTIKDLSNLTFEDIDRDKYRAIDFAFDCLNKEESFAVVLNAANEVAVEKFLNEDLTIKDIYSMVEEQLNKHVGIERPTLEQIYEIDQQVRKDMGA